MRRSSSKNDENETTMRERVARMIELWEVEINVLEKIVYKNRNQHGRTVYFRKFIRAARYAKYLPGDVLRETFGDASRAIRQAQSDGVVETRSRLIGLLGIIDRSISIATYAEKACSPFQALLSRTYFMPLALMCISLLGRIRSLALHFARCAVYYHSRVLLFLAKRCREKVQCLHDFSIPKCTLLRLCKTGTIRTEKRESIKCDSDRDIDDDASVSVGFNRTSVWTAAIETDMESSSADENEIDERKCDDARDSIASREAIVEVNSDSDDIVESESLKKTKSEHPLDEIFGGF